MNKEEMKKKRFKIVERNEEFWLYDGKELIRIYKTKNECDKYICKVLNRKTRGSSIFTKEQIKNINKELNKVRGEDEEN